MKRRLTEKQRRREEARKKARKKDINDLWFWGLAIIIALVWLAIRLGNGTL